MWQGCPLSPILFNIYVNDIFQTMNENNECDIFLKENESINVLMFADDLILLPETRKGLQCQIDKLWEYCKQRKLNINSKQNKIMVFDRGNRLIESAFYPNNTIFENVKTIKYLGYIITANNCSFSKTLEDISMNDYRAIFALNTKTEISPLPTKLFLVDFDCRITWPYERKMKTFQTKNRTKRQGIVYMWKRYWRWTSITNSSLYRDESLQHVTTC